MWTQRAIHGTALSALVSVTDRHVSHSWTRDIYKSEYRVFLAENCCLVGLRFSFFFVKSKWISFQKKGALISRFNLIKLIENSVYLFPIYNILNWINFGEFFLYVKEINPEMVELKFLLKQQRFKSSFPIAKDFLCNNWQPISSPSVPILTPLLV